ncbi:unnamed protein product, partial [marine sediment metagenome]
MPLYLNQDRGSSIVSLTVMSFLAISFKNSLLDS